MVPTVINVFRPYQQPSQMHDAGFRLFRVEDPSGVVLPGCTKVDEVRLDGTMIPPYVDERVLLDTTMKNFKDLRIPLYDLIEGPDGPLLIRSMKSNDGNWQVGSVVAVRGEWSQESDGLDEMKQSELQEEGVRMGLNFPRKGMKKIDMINAIRDARALASR